jgi:hypothetical protein
VSELGDTPDRAVWREMRDSMVSVLAGQKPSQETHDALVSTIRALIAELDTAVDARESVVPSPQPAAVFVECPRCFHEFTIEPAAVSPLPETEQT